MRQFKYDNLTIEYSKPSITPFREGYIKSVDEIMYYYYSINIFLDEEDEDGNGNKVVKRRNIFSSDAYDFPKVQNLAPAIDYIVKEDCPIVLEDYRNDGFHRLIKYNQLELDDMNVEYFYRIERYDYSVKQSCEEEYKHWTKYKVTISEGFLNSGWSDKKCYGSSIYLDNLNKEELLQLRDVANDFVQYSIDEYNRETSETTTLCPECKKRITIYDYISGERNYENLYKCPHCNKEFDDEADGFYENMKYGENDS